MPRSGCAVGTLHRRTGGAIYMKRIALLLVGFVAGAGLLWLSSAQAVGPGKSDEFMVPAILFGGLLGMASTELYVAITHAPKRGEYWSVARPSQQVSTFAQRITTFKRAFGHKRPRSGRHVHVHAPESSKTTDQIQKLLFVDDNVVMGSPRRIPKSEHAIRIILMRIRSILRTNESSRS